MRRIVALVLLVSTALAAGSFAAENDVARRMAEAHEAYHRYQDVVGAMKIYRALAEEGHVPAQLQLAYILDQADEDAEAVRWYRLAAQQGNEEAMLFLGQHLATGDGVEADEAEALKLFEQAAAGGNDQAMLMLAVAHLEGKYGLPVSESTAVSWFIRAGEQGNVNAARRLFEAYSKGLMGLAVDAQQASYWDQRRRAAGAGKSNKQHEEEENR